MRPALQVRLPVRILPGNQVLELSLDRDTTAGDIIDQCLEELAKDQTLPDHECWNLVADLQGYEKRFIDSERLYQLIKKHILLAGNVEGVRFFLRRRKKRFSLCSVADDDSLSPIENLNKTNQLLSSVLLDESTISTSTTVEASSGYDTDVGAKYKRALSKRRLFRPSSDMIGISGIRLAERRFDHSVGKPIPLAIHHGTEGAQQTTTKADHVAPANI